MHMDIEVKGEYNEDSEEEIDEFGDDEYKCIENSQDFYNENGDN